MTECLCDDLTPDDVLETEEQLAAEKASKFCISHFYDIGDQRVFIQSNGGDVDIVRAAVYCEAMCGEWFGHARMLSNLGVAALLVMFYGCKHIAVLDSYTSIDMHKDVERLARDVMADPSLVREGMKQAMAPFTIPC